MKIKRAPFRKKWEVGDKNFHMTIKDIFRAKIIKKNGSYFLAKFPSTGSGIISSISQSNGIIELEKSSSFIKKGALLKFYRYEDMLN